MIHAEPKKTLVEHRKEENMRISYKTRADCDVRGAKKTLTKCGT